MMRFLFGASCSCLVSFFSAFDFLTSSCFFGSLWLSHTTLSPTSIFSLVLPLLPTTTPPPNLLFVVLTTLCHHPFNTAHNPPPSLTASPISASRGYSCSGLFSALVCCLWTPLYIIGYVLIQLWCFPVPLFNISNPPDVLRKKRTWFHFGYVLVLVLLHK